MKTAIGFGILGLVAVWVTTPPVAVASPEPTVSVLGTQFQVRAADGRELAQGELPGTILTVGDGSGRTRTLRIDAVETDPRDPDGEVMLYALSEPDTATGAWRNACLPDPDGRQLGFPLAGHFTPDMRYVPESGQFLITCTGGAEGKCVRFGYKPWGQTSDGRSLLPYYQTCVRLVRADYLGDGVGHTRNGTPIDIFDRIGIQADERVAGMTLEAAWGPEGAACVQHTRFVAEPPLDDLDAAPRLRGHTGQHCDETVPGLLYNRSFESRR